MSGFRAAVAEGQCCRIKTCEVLVVLAALQVNGTALAAVHARTINNILNATLDTTIARRSMSESEHNQHPSLPLREEDLNRDVQRLERGSESRLRAAEVTAAVREVRRLALELVSSMSSLSLKQAVDGQGPVVVRTDSFVINSTRINVAAFDGAVLALQGANASAILPSGELELPQNHFQACNALPR
eukprot:1102614-Rhodomonas_salina.3